MVFTSCQGLSPALECSFIGFIFFVVPIPPAPIHTAGVRVTKSTYCYG